MTSPFCSASQNCIGIERIIALPKVYKQLTDILELRISKLRLGSAVDEDQVHMGAMIAPTCFDKLERIIKEAVGKGARCLGHYFQPTLLVDVTPDMEIAQNETFAPICVLMPVQNVDEAIKIANSANFGLGGSVYGKNQAHIDRDFYLNQGLPFGGYGRFAGEGLGDVCNLKSVLVDRWNFTKGLLQFAYGQNGQSLKEKTGDVLQSISSKL
ncbi:Aldehyde/histidinol dehydrogenase [Terfezia claveryi]|nr:Aldehyde/histidinol dehydrogenase [Terfezia claveryi]